MHHLITNTSPIPIHSAVLDELFWCSHLLARRSGESVASRAALRTASATFCSITTRLASLPGCLPNALNTE